MGIHLNKVTILDIELRVFFLVLLLFRISTSDNLPANFVFGDSLVDVGNNNYILSLSKANFLPFGVDFGRPTGRFTNGRTIVDIIGQELGFDLTPPYLAPTTIGPVILKGVNYASGGGGILNLSGQVLGGRLNFDAQIDYFANTRHDIISSIGVPEALDLLKNALFSVTIGSNDFINNYLAQHVAYAMYKSDSPETFVTTLISKLRTQLTRLFNLGARKIVVVNVGPIGCIPNQRDANLVEGDGCVTFPNQLAILFNTQLKSLVAELNSNLAGSKFVYADVYHILEDILINYAALAWLENLEV
ncbi:GDSL esterase/lipase At4g16230 isoform X2 [Lathyrus oleraceus]|uniref:GDSL esterase/lipase n=1 Tax=Pisum sativum TaxID=3888 RepID=A0A9D5ANK7_PEA|nr:GDSL esterase/lipase At4g16230-like isoform X2 [Pisum sativum]KAI5415583.1 hypothetical protein KIW84_040850 [Pisum sativum]